MTNKVLFFLVFFSFQLFVVFSQEVEPSLDITTQEENNTKENVPLDSEEITDIEKINDDAVLKGFEQSFITSDNQLRLYKYEDEILNISNGEYGVKEIVTATKDVLIRKEYDSLMRINKIIEWRHDNSQWSRTTETEYFYLDNGNYPQQSIQKFLNENRKINNFYDEKGYTVRTQEFFSDSKEIVSEDDYLLLKEKQFVYDSQHRVLTEITIQDGKTYIIENDYSKELLYPDKSIYEIGSDKKKILKEQYEYETDEYFVRTINFTIDYKVVLEYEKDALINTIYYKGDKEIRRINK